jgi:hypothetical protein
MGRYKYAFTDKKKVTIVFFIISFYLKVGMIHDTIHILREKTWHTIKFITITKQQ